MAGPITEYRRAQRDTGRGQLPWRPRRTRGVLVLAAVIGCWLVGFVLVGVAMG